MVPGIFGGKKRLKDMLHNILVHTNAGVGDGKADKPAGLRPWYAGRIFLVKGHLFGPDSYFTAIGHNVTGVYHQVHDDLLHIPPVGFYTGNLRVQNRYHLNILANEAAYRDGADWLDQLLPYLDGNHDHVVAYTKEKMPLVDYTKAQGTYLAWLDVAKLVDKIDATGKAETASKTSERPVTPERIVQRWFIDNAHVYLNPGSSYGTGGSGHMRMNLGTSRKLITLAMDNMAEAMDKL